MDADRDPAMNPDTDSEPVVEPDSNSPGLLAIPVSIPTQPDARPEFIPFTTPYLCSAADYDYHERGFYDFPERQGWMFQYNHEKDTHPMRSHRRRRVPQDMVEKRPCDPIKLKPYRVDGGDARLADLVAFLQAWLFFGVLAEISATCGLSIDIEREFLVDGTHVSTAALNGLAQRWVEAARMQASGDMKTRIERVSWVLTYATSLLHFGDSRNIQVRKLSYPEVKALFAIEIAFRVVVLALEKSGVYDDEKLKGFRFGLLAGFPLPLREISAFAREELLQKGWCKSEIAMMDSVAGMDPDAPPYHFFAAALERGNMDHSKCEKVKCLADQIDENTYETAHVKVGCQCAAEYGLVSVSGEDLRAVLEEGNVPRISISDDLELTVVRDHPYVAISHVWSHGLGNPFENALPRCQIRQLRGHLADLNSRQSSLGPRTDHPLALWIDTLCIPVAPHLKQYRKKAITLLGQIYSDAIVLVLDRELKDLHPHSVSPLEQSLRILCCGWMRRLWTLQEAILARNLFLQLHDEAIPFTRPQIPAGPTYMHSLHLPGSQIQFLLFNDLENTLKSARIPTVTYLRSPPSAYNWTGSAYKNLISAAQHRSTSKAQDEPIILATIMGLGVREVLEAQEKMAQFHVLMRRIPGDLIFLDLNGRNLRHAPFRWAPATLLESEIQSLSLDTEHTLAVCDEDGLHVVYGGFIFSGEARETRLLETRFCIRDRVQGDKYIVQIKQANQRRVELPQKPAMIFRGRGGDAVIVDILDTMLGGEETRVVVVAYANFGSFSDGAEPAESLEGDMVRRWRKWCVT